MFKRFLLFFFFFFFSTVFAVSFYFDDNFDSYSLGLLNGQGGWVSGSSFVVSSDQFISSSNSLRVENSASTVFASSPFTSIGTVWLSYKLKVTESCGFASLTNFTFGLSGELGSSPVPGAIRIKCTDNDDVLLFTLGQGINSYDVSFSRDVWQYVSVEVVPVSGGWDQNYYLNGYLATSTLYVADTSSYIDSIRMTSTRNDLSSIVLYIDDIVVSDVGLGITGDSTSSYIVFDSPLNGDVVATTTLENTFNVSGSLFLSSDDIVASSSEEFYVILDVESYENPPDNDDVFVFNLGSVNSDDVLDSIFQFDFFDVGTGNLGYHLGVLKLVPFSNPQGYYLYDSVSFYVSTSTTDFYEYESDLICDKFADSGSYIEFAVCKVSVFLYGTPKEIISRSVSGFKDTFLIKAPWGYATRAYDIIIGSATTTLPALTISFPSGISNSVGLSNYSFDFDIFSKYESALDVIDTKEVENVEGSPLDFLLYWWTFIWNIVVFLWLLKVLWGFAELGDFGDLGLIGGSSGAHGRVREDIHGRKYREYSTRDIKKRIRYSNKDPGGKL